MFPFPQGGPHKELTSEANRKQMADLNRELIGILAVIEMDNACLVFPEGGDYAKLPDPSGVFAEQFIELTAALEAKFRQDYVEAIKAATPERVGLSLSTGTTPAANGAERAIEVTPKRRGL